MDPGAGPESSLTVNEQVSSGSGEGVRVMDQAVWASRRTPQSPSLFLTKLHSHFTYPDVIASQGFSGAEFGDLSYD